jgi:hypothetical protein
MQKESLVERLTNGRGIRWIVDFDTSRKPIDNMEPMQISHDYKHDLYALDIGPIGCPTSSVAQANLTIKINFNILRSFSSSDIIIIYLHAFL